MASTYIFRVLSHEATLFEGEVVSVMAPAYEGSVGIMAHHAPYLTTLTKGDLMVRVSDDEVHNFVVDGGVLEVSGGEAVLLTESIEEKK
ncbi:MAG: F0F1 ATP synthase subunit epsilon [Candidatus Hinthialibacter antarcticus]|nr:F0F1 ATP synthase subunit epsilon [Candidatus Hinthialibacter antarcticus]